MFSTLKDYGTARFFEEHSAPGQVRCWTSAWRRTQAETEKDPAFFQWVGPAFNVRCNARDDLTVLAEGQHPRTIAPPKKPVVSAAQFTLAERDALCGEEPSTPKFDHTALKAEWKEKSTGANHKWWACECKGDGGNWCRVTNPHFHNTAEYRIVKGYTHPDVVRAGVKADYEAACKSGEIKHWDVEFRWFTMPTWKKCPNPSWITYGEYRLVKRDTHPDVVREKVRVEWEEMRPRFHVRHARLEYKNVDESDTEWKRCFFPIWVPHCDYRIVYLPAKKLIDMSAMPAGTNTTVGKIVGHHLFQKPGSVFALAEGATHVQEWQARDVDLVEKQDWVKWEATTTSVCPIPDGVKYIAKFAGLPDDYEAAPEFPGIQWKKYTSPYVATIIAFKILGAKEGYTTFSAK